ncbi:patatin-like phospholipase family protein [Maribacter dokdonensis]|uniref:patatin-like phospholipase family protein n=1 Tax=Maribacter dokdonensis TaxID=320912 RepID=UPI001C07FF3C|nr:patatin-like phospholipase family protein [Maribacter dokdonensis]MBU2902679.1 patatin-like phospholipase family protein [Maribacter dokdonensis]MDP2524511.1 patatin-like phospholipase family protein [Maribacter dokdonensis]
MYKILSLDGGGSWAIMQLLTLKDRYGNMNGHQILNKFDLVIANSGGSIVLAALAEDYSIDKAISLFKEEKNRAAIFHKNRFKDRYFPVDYLGLFNAGFGPKYSTKRKKEAFEHLFPQIDKIQMNELPKHIGKDSLKIIVATYDALNNRAKFFKSFSNHSATDDSVRLTQAINASSNAPVQYFDFPARFKAQGSDIFYELWDGALGGFNNPILAGIIEAYKLGVDLKTIRIVSLGTSNSLMSEDAKKDFWNWKQIALQFRRKKLRFSTWKPQLNFFKETVLHQAKTILYQPPDTANYIAMMFLKAATSKDLNDQIIRLSPLIHYDVHTPKEIVPLVKDLYLLDMDLTKDEEIDKLITCFIAWKNGDIYNQPIEFRVERSNNLLFLQGDKWYKDGMDRWITWEL